jgi:hypothetical protein
MRQGKATVRSGVFYPYRGAIASAPLGEYEFCEADGAVRLTRAGAEFALSGDSFCRLVAEGRITLAEETA